MVTSKSLWDVLRTSETTFNHLHPHSTYSVGLDAPTYTNNFGMSFHWNLSSDDDEEEEDALATNVTNAKVVRDIPSLATTFDRSDGDGHGENRTGSCVAPHTLKDTQPPTDWYRSGDAPRSEYDYNNIGNDDDYDDEVDWEDVELSEEEDDRKPAATNGILPKASLPAVTLRPITIDLDHSKTKTKDDNASSQPSKKRKRRNVFRMESLPYNMQSLLQNLHQAHVLSWTGHAIHISNLCSNPEIMALAYSLIPDVWDVPSQHPHPCSSNTNSIKNVKLDHHPTASYCIPSLQHMRQFVKEWYIPLVHDMEQRRRQQQYVNRRAGAPILLRRRKNLRQGHRINRKGKATTSKVDDPDIGTTHNLFTLLQLLISYLSKTVDDDPQLAAESTIPWILQNVQWKDQLFTGLLIVMVRALGWRARLVCAIEPIPMDLTVNHPLLTSFRNNIFTSVKPAKKTRTMKHLPDEIESKPGTDHSIGMLWVEILCRDDHNTKNPNYRWFHVDPIHKLINQPETVEGLLGQRMQQQQRYTLAYTVSVEHSLKCNYDSSVTQEPPRLRLTDVTPRYAQSWIASLRKRGIIRNKNCDVEDLVRNSWWTKTLGTINAVHRPMKSIHTSIPFTANGGSIQDPIRLDDIEDNVENLDPLDDHENDELVKAANNESIPTSKAGFKTHPIYVIPSELGKTEVLHPDAKQRVCGVFKGQLVYRRSDVSTMYTAKKWLYVGQKVRDSEIAKPIKTQTKRKKPPTKGFKALRSYGVGVTNDGDEDRQIELGSIPLDDDTDKLYGIWQTDPWSPAYVGPNDDIPTNEFKNIELALLNPGLVHIDQTGLAGVAKKLGIPYAPCLLGFEGHGGNRTPTVRGIVVHAHNEQLIREAGAEVHSFEVEQACSDRRRFLLLQWKRLMVGLLTKDRLEREYGNDDNK
jgi:Rad4 beta-hairpin domain 3/Rad4 beta-hairpin domain 1